MGEFETEELETGDNWENSSDGWDDEQETEATLQQSFGDSLHAVQRNVFGSVTTAIPVALLLFGILFTFRKVKQFFCSMAA